MKTETGSSASFASLAALAASAFLVSAALAASWAAAAASSLDFALALAASSCVCSSSTFAAASGFCAHRQSDEPLMLIGDPVIITVSRGQVEADIPRVLHDNVTPRPSRVL